MRRVCRLWPTTRQLAATGGQLSPGWTGAEVLTEFRAFGEVKEWRGAGRLGAHSFRRGSALAILKAGGSSSQLLRAGQCRSSAYQLYSDLSSEESRAAASILVEASDDE